MGVFDKEGVLRYLDGRGVRYERVDHEAVYTMAGAGQVDIPFADKIVKNLFLRDDKKRAYYLAMMPLDKPANLKALRAALGSRPLSFASQDDLAAILGLHPGAVSPFGVLNDEDRRTEVVIDQVLQSYGAVGVHPNDNTTTILVPLDALTSIFDDHGTPWRFIEME